VFVPLKAVHDAALAISEQGDITQDMFEDVYHCRFGMSHDSENYWLHFDTQEYASMFLLRWM